MTKETEMTKEIEAYVGALPIEELRGLLALSKRVSGLVPDAFLPEPPYSASEEEWEAWREREAREEKLWNADRGLLTRWVEGRPPGASMDELRAAVAARIGR